MGPSGMSNSIVAETLAAKLKLSVVECAGDMKSHSGSIICLPPNAPTNTELMDFYAKDGIVVYLDAPPAAWSKEENSGELRELYESKHDVRVLVGEGETPSDVCSEIMSVLKLNQDYASTRGFFQEGMQFLDVVHRGLAPDRGLFVAK